MNEFCLFIRYFKQTSKFRNIFHQINTMTTKTCFINPKASDTWPRRTPSHQPWLDRCHYCYYYYYCTIVINISSCSIGATQTGKSKESVKTACSGSANHWPPSSPAPQLPWLAAGRSASSVWPHPPSVMMTCFLSEDEDQSRREDLILRNENK